MWWKVLLLTLYLVLLFLLSRLLEAVGHLEGSYLASRLLDPVSMSVKKLKTILDQRGVSYAGVVEKTELTELVESSGDVMEGELESAAVPEESSTVTSFTGGSHFYEEVEDTKDSVWLVQVVQDASLPMMRGMDWDLLVHKLARFGVRTGILDCSLDFRLCNRKGWFGNRLILALPQGYRVKDNVVIKTYSNKIRVQSIFNWVNKNLAARVKDIKSVEELHEDWFHFNGRRREEKVRVILFSRLKIRPMFYSVLSAKFSGRVQFGHVNVKIQKGICENLGLKWIPQYMIITPEMNYTYGNKAGEYLNYRSMALYLRCYHPEVNDIFLFSLVVINLACWLELFIAQGTIFRRLGRLLWCIGKWNCALILLWLPLLGLIQLPFVDRALGQLLWLLRVVSSTDTAALLRADWLWVSSLHFGILLLTFLAYAIITGYMHYRFLPEPPEPDRNNNTASFWESNWDSYLAPATLTRPWTPRDLDMEVGMELLMERLAVISTDYIKDLPVWKYQGLAYDSDVCSDCEGARSESDPEDVPQGMQGNIGKQPLMFVCEKCRALQSEQDKSPAERMRENAESEMACAKFVMDGDYKCQCHLDSGGHHGHGHNRGRSRSPRHSRSKQSKKEKEATDEDDPGEGMPPGMLPVAECVVCLDSYRFGDALCGLPCGHSFHQECIIGWLSRDNHCCPVCRWPTYKAKPCQMHLHVE